MTVDTPAPRRQFLRHLLIGGIIAALPLWAPAAHAFGSPDAAVAPPAQDETPMAMVVPTIAGSPRLEKAVLAGGCFWGVQGVFEHVEGVRRVISGYAGGRAETAHYQTVGGGRSDHAESVEITFDPARVTYGTLLRIFFSVAHDPTEVNRQGPDSGPQYRSAIFPATETQARVAQGYIAQLDAAHAFPAPIATRIEPGAGFYPAEDYHQDFLTRHPDHPYIVVNDLPKIAQLKRLFPDRYREQPVLVEAAAAAPAH
ncbi:peptide-methionine (S)-S-oxide reductase MsrA [Telmatospirillum siberiense]|uniref:Peptide methionine sulfoxide reductase MsrA n=1 Tax=Telmatospirillum siberiense TaxID=382514 RepID=A0A2N3PUM3_9PROT|nr:peptide-methionine (S)-S-oxide reductase MsrA [Telmatospirillum siberiense]PKU24097.1 peptide-methionine (S)-S-oxide reductase [Telmatospirillum siberiense]